MRYNTIKRHFGGFFRAIKPNGWISSLTKKLKSIDFCRGQCWNLHLWRKSSRSTWKSQNSEVRVCEMWNCGHQCGRIILSSSAFLLAGSSHLGANVLQLSILQPPQYVTGGVPSNAKVERVKRGEQLPPHLWTENHEYAFESGRLW